MPVRRLWPRTNRGLLYANLLVYGSTIALLVGFQREIAWAVKTVDGYVRSGWYQPTADRLLVREATRHRERHEADLEGVAALLERAVEVDAYSSARIHLAETYREQGKNDEALAMYERYRSIDPLTLQVYLAMVEILEERGERKKAEQLLTEGITHFRNYIKHYEPQPDPSAAKIFNSKARAVYQGALKGLSVLKKTRARIRESM